MNERDVFDAALAISDSQQRAAFLEQACGENQTQRREIEEMLDAQQRLGSFLHGPPAGLEATIDSPIVEKPGTQIGPYKLLQRIGEGGFGVVYMAEQHKPVRRKVALKIIKPGMDTKEVIARFEAERQALALMDHPNIAKVFDAGATDTGRPYFVMELVKGVPLIDFCDENHLTTKQRLELFVKVCRAIQHAHQKGIIHRDLKPSNVMVTIHDNKPVPKIIDFGVSKAISQQLTEKTLFTAYGQMLGTPTYMSPEQAQMSGLDVDTRSDIYSLGVMLFELLSGSTPLDAERLRKSGYEEMQRLIREEEAPRPSQRLSTHSGEALASIAKCRGAEAGQLEKQLRGELDWIVIKALEKDRNRRYETANGFAADVERHLNHEAVHACPPSLAYRARKFIHRNRRAALTVGTLLAATVLAVVGLSVGYIRETRSAVVARQEKQRAEELMHKERQARLDAVAAGKRAETAMHKERQARLDAVAAGKSKDEALTDVHTTLGLSAEEQGQTALARAYFANAARLAPDEQRARFNRIRTRSWSNNMLVPTAVLPHSAEWIADVQVYADGKYVMTRVLGPEHDNEPPDLGEIIIWDVENSKPLELPAELASPQAARWSPDGAWLAAINSEGELCEVEFPSLRIRDKLATDLMVHGLWFSPSGRYLAIYGGHDVHVWDCQQQEFTTPRLTHPDDAYSVRFNLEEDRFVTSCRDGYARVFGVPGDSDQPLFPPVEHLVQRFYLESGHLPRPAVLVGDRLFTRIRRGEGERLVCWDAASGEQLQSWRSSRHRNMVTDGQRFVVQGGADVLAIDVEQLDQEASVIRLDYPRFAAIDPANDRLALAGPTFLRWYSLPGLQEMTRSTAINRNVNVMEFAPDGSCLVTAERGGFVKVWRSIERNPGSYSVPHGGPSLADMSRDGKYFVPIGLSQRSSQLRMTRIYEVETGRAVGELIRPDGVLIDGKMYGHRLALATSLGSNFSRARNQGRQPGQLSLWNWRTGARLSTFSLDVEPRSLDVSPDGSRVAVLSADGNVFVLDGYTGKPVVEPWRAHEPYLQNNWFRNNGEIAYSPDGHYIIMWGTDNYARFWHADSSDRLRYELEHVGRVLDLAFSPDGKRVATAEMGGDRAQVWEFASGKPVGAPMQHPNWVHMVRFSGDGTRIVSGCRDRAARVWDWRTGKLVCPPMAHPHEVHTVSFLSKHGDQLILTACDKNGVRVWECLTGKPVTPPIPIRGFGLTFSPTPSESHVVVGGWGTPMLPVLCLDEILADGNDSTDDLVAMAEFFSGHRVNKGGLQRLTPAESLEIYTKLRSKIHLEAGRQGYDAPQFEPLPAAQSERQRLSLLRLLDGFFQRQDKNGDKVVTESECSEIPWRLYSPHDSNGDGRLEIEEVRRSLEEGIPEESRGRILTPPKRLSPLEKFTEHDADGDGQVIKGEAGQDYWDTIKQFDGDGDDVVDRAELEAGLREQSLASRRRFFAKVDRNNDGQLNSEELRGLWEKSKSFDSDGDNQLNQDEFLKATEPKKEDDQSQPH